MESGMTLIASPPHAILAWSEPTTVASDQDLLGTSPPMRTLRRLLRQVAPYDVPVLLEGEEGTGKRLVAEVIHGRSSYRGGPFVLLDCTAVATMRLPFELFGCAAGICGCLPQGCPGLLELAQGGTLFLRHVEALPSWAQARLLQVLETGTVERLGATDGVTAHVRIIAAITTGVGTQDKPAAAERLRADLGERLSGGVVLNVPPLRERGRDVLLLSQHFLRQANRETDRDVRGFSKEARIVLARYSWPGNLRELQRCVQWAVTKAGRQVTADHLPRRVCAGGWPARARPPFGTARHDGFLAQRGH
ncbi:MAG: sigma 54-interacting transcriptional regulator [Nitrospirota bacterium]